MDTKLTLKLDENIIAEAKLYAKSKQISLSLLIENYLKKLTTEKKSKEEITPLVKSLSGVIDLPDDFNARDNYTNHLIKKYKQLEKVFVDTDIVLDLLSARQPHHKYAAILFSHADQGKIKIFISSLAFANLNYILSKQLSANQSRKLLVKLKTLVTVLPVNDKIIALALESDFNDFEDAIQYHVARENNINTLLTRNLRDFKKSQIVILTSQQFLKSID